MKAFKYIRTNEQVKYLILNCMQHIKFPIELIEIFDVCSWCDEGFTYFDFTQALSELYEKVLVHSYEKDGKELYWLTEKGKGAAKIFKNDIPHSVRDMAAISALRVTKRIIRDEHIFTKTVQIDSDDFDVTLTMKDVIQIKMSVGTFEQSTLISKNFKQNAESIFQEVLTSIITERDKKD